MKGGVMRKNEIPHLEEQLAYLQSVKDEEIDFSDIPEILDWSKAVRGKFYRPAKEHISIRLDSDVLAWFKSREEKYQSAINNVLREYMLAHL